eukprot:scaffold232128_cov18-Tisochrysis_lutea.AAC.1
MPAGWPVTASRNRERISGCPSAAWRGAMPVELVAAGFARASKSARTTPAWPLPTALCRGVSPFLSLASIGAPAERRSWQLAACPAYDAT